MEKIKLKKYKDKGTDFKSYFQLCSELVQQNKSTAQEDSVELAEYAKLNIHRMKRVGKTVKLTDELIKTAFSLKTKQYWLVLSESWCGDAAQNLPVLNLISDLSGTIELKVFLRDENLELMDLFLTNGGRSIPKLISIDENGNILFTWGPRPGKVQKLVLDNKKEGTKTYQELAVDIHKWYAQNKGLDLQHEFIELLTNKV